jgi:ABC-type transporter Mla maintaining outer membrane lipid asymmetry ATPase subunit MlaF
VNSAGIAFAYQPPNGSAALQFARGSWHRAAPHDRESVNTLINAALEFEVEAGAHLIVLDADPQILDDAGRAALRSRIGFLAFNGGLISHLNGWENAVLPLGFHQPQRLPGIAPQVFSLLDTLVGGTPALLAKLPEDMTVLESKAIGFTRTLLLAPDLLLVEDFDRGLAPGDRPRIDAFIAAYRRVCPDGTLVQFDNDISV